jgi:hypothetical protein
MFDIFYLGPKPNLFPHEQAVDSIEQAQETSSTRYCWVVNYLTDYTGFDFLWEPVPWEADQTHIWPSQHQANGGTYLVPKSGGQECNRNHSVLPRRATVPVVGIDHGNGLTVACDYQTRFISDYLGTLKRVLSKVSAEYVWVISSVCDYTDFDFTWHPSEWQDRMLHVFPSNEQKFGDTFYVHVPSFLDKTKNLALLEWFDTIHFVEDCTVPRCTVPVVCHNHDSQVSAIMSHDFTDPVVQFTVNSVEPLQIPALNLWRQETRAVTPLSAGAGTVIVPRDAKNFIKTQVYDYPVIDKSHKTICNDRPLDIVFISNGEVNADYNYEKLKFYAGDWNRIRRVDGVNGRVAAYHAAAKSSTTPWFFAVFAKLEVEPTFDWSWQPDRLQQAKHYIFHARNPVNGLEYGHQAIIAYNKQLVLDNSGTGLDFTLDSAHEVVPILSGTAYYYNDPWMCWRTAFREALKLRATTDVESQYRLRQWLKPCESRDDYDYAKWSHIGAQDAVEYYESVGGDFAELRKSYDWAWLSSYAFVKHGLTPDR